METLTWFLTFAILFVWMVVGIELMRRPPAMPSGRSMTIRRILWGAAWVLALALGVWGPELWSTTGTDHASRGSVGVPVELTSSVLRTPFAVRTLRSERDLDGRLLSSERRLGLQLPLALLGFLALVFLVRAHEARGSAGPVGRTATLLLPLLWAGCGESALENDTPRPDRQVVEVGWDTLFYMELDLNDTLVYGIDHLAAAERGFWALDRSGFRVAHFDWEGELQWYAGQRGAGPGELTNPRSLDLDRDDRVWVLDLATSRVTGFGPDGGLDGSISLLPLEGVLHGFSVAAAGDRVFGMVMGDGLTPVSVDARGRVETGSTILLNDVRGISGIALQGVVTGAAVRDRWVYGFVMGDGFYLMDGVELGRGRLPYPEAVPFPGLVVRESEGADASTRTQQLSEPHFAAASITTNCEKLLVRFAGETPARGRLLDVYDFESGEYEETLILPRAGPIAAWGERIVVAWNDPAPRLMVIRARR